MLTLKLINEAIAAEGLKAELVKHSSSRFRFVGADVKATCNRDVDARSINSLSLEYWLYRAKLATGAKPE